MSFPIRKETERERESHGIFRSSRRWIFWRRVFHKQGMLYILPKCSQLICYYGWYSNKSRGMRKEAAAEAPEDSSSDESAATSSSQSWVMMLKRVYDVDSLCGPECGGQMKVVSFIESPQEDVIEAILNHCGLWQSRSPRAPPDVDDMELELDAAYSGSSIDSPDEADQFQEPTYVAIDTFLERF